MQHGGVVGCVERAEARAERADALIAVDLEVENLDGEGVARLRAFDVKGTRERVVPRSHAERVAGFLNGVAEAVEGVGVEDVSGLEVGHRCRSGIDVLHVVKGALVFDDGGGLRMSRGCAGDDEEKRFHWLMRGKVHECFSEIGRKLTSAAEAAGERCDFRSDYGEQTAQAGEMA